MSMNPDIEADIRPVYDSVTKVIENMKPLLCEYMTLDTHRALFDYMRKFDEEIRIQSTRGYNSAFLKFSSRFMKDYHKMYHESFKECVVPEILMLVCDGYTQLGYDCEIIKENDTMGLRVQWSSDIPTHHLDKILD